MKVPGSSKRPISRRARHGSRPECPCTSRPRLSDALIAWAYRRLGRCQVHPGECARGEAPELASLSRMTLIESMPSAAHPPERLAATPNDPDAELEWRMNGGKWDFLAALSAALRAVWLMIVCAGDLCIAASCLYKPLTLNPKP